ncbi:unnamed protein product [Paramecium sonneborni]|uniref:Uncharacterized protein n=1 Tax=Paramecium sonneborni TaxID=65129 RepID=A0A8S1N4D0_9CILI|nr:unnamed protein product [Paramecium sonneborni]
MNDELEKTANFFFPVDNQSRKQKFIHTRRQLKHPIQNNVSNPSTQITTSKRSSDNSGVEGQHTPPQIYGIRKRSELYTNSEDRKPNNFRILSSNSNQRSSYAQQFSFGNQFKLINEFLQNNDNNQSPPFKQLKKLPEIFSQRNSSQGFRQGSRILSGQNKRETMSNFIKDNECSKEQFMQQFQLKQTINKQQQQLRVTQNKLPNIGQPVSFLQTKQQLKMINKIFSGKRDQ